MSYLQGDLNDAGRLRRVGEHLAELDKTAGDRRQLSVLSCGRGSFLRPVVAGLGAAGLTTEQDGKWRRVVIEKPFGHDLPSAKALNADILKTLQEHQIYRIDHFLGKETVQNIMALRFANGLFEPLWNRHHIDHVQITAAETVGVEHRGNFYEKTGALRDMVPNHMFQLLAMTAMEPPISFDADAVRSKKAEVIQAIQPLTPEQALRDAVRGQYDAGTVMGKPARPIADEPESRRIRRPRLTSLCKLIIDNWRWAGVPFYLRTGKHLQAPVDRNRDPLPSGAVRALSRHDVERMNPNWMILRIQPDEGIALEFAAKRPGPRVKLSTVSMDFAYKTYFKMAPNTGYETLIYDCMIGDATLFQRADNVEAGWQAVQPILDAWANNPPRDFPNYAAGSERPGRGRRIAGARRARLASAGLSEAPEDAMAQSAKISLVLADVDGTLVTEDKVLTEARAGAVQALHDAGIRFAITSGRPPRGMAMLFDPLELDTPIAGFNGGLFVKRGSRRSSNKDAAARCRARGDRTHSRARPRCLGLSRQRLADHQDGRAACRARGLDRQVRA